MDSLSIPAVAIASAVLGVVFAWLLLRTRSAVLREQAATLGQTLAAAREELKAANSSNSDLKAQVAGLNSTVEQERRASAEKLQLVNSASVELRQAFQALAADALSSNNESFLQLARTRLEKFQAGAEGDLEARQKAVENLVMPIKESLNKVDAQIQQIEQERSHAYGALTEQVRSSMETQERLRDETGNLVKALRAPSVRGRWGELHLRQVVETAGMLDHCDFEEQVSVDTDDGRLRPDMVVKLPAGKNIVVDAKTPLQAYLDAVETSDEDVRKVKLLEHAQQVRGHIAKLGAKSYAAQFQAAPEFVVMFLPLESLFSAALEQDSGLIEYGAKQRVILASPTTLLSLFMTVAHVWTQEKISENAKQISELGKELYERLCTFVTHIGKVGKSLDQAAESYNKAVSSLESRVLVSARRFPELGVASVVEIPALAQIETTSRTLALVWAEEEIVATNEQTEDESNQ